MAMINVENEVAINYHGIVIYHVYKNDYMEDGARTFWFSLDPYGSDCAEESFDVRDASGYNDELSIEANLVRMIDEGAFGETNIMEREGTGKDDYYPESESKVGICPVCSAMIKEYGEIELRDKSIGYPYSCPNCGVSGIEWHSLVFDGFTVS